MRAVWNGAVLADSDATTVVEGNHCVPPQSRHAEHFARTGARTVCPWQGTASDDSSTVEGQTSTGAAWTYRALEPAAVDIAGYVAFWRVVGVADAEGSDRGGFSGRASS